MNRQKRFAQSVGAGLWLAVAALGVATAQPASTPGQPAPDADPPPPSRGEPESPAADRGVGNEGSAGNDGGAGNDDGMPAAAAPDAIDPTAGSVPVGTAAEHDADAALVDKDVAPTVRVFESDDLELRMGGLMQVHFAPYVGDESLLANDDAATRAGFRLRRARIGVEGQYSFQGDSLGNDAIAYILEFLLVVNPLESDTEVGTVSDAKISLRIRPEIKLAVGTGKVPFSHGNLESSSALPSIERALSVRTLAPDRRLGITLGGEVLRGRLAYLGGFMNGTEGYDQGNRFGGFLYAARVRFSAWGMPDTRRPAADGVAIGASGFFEDGPATTQLAGSVDVLLTFARTSVKLEALFDRQTPKDDPVTSPMVPEAFERFGAYAEVAYTLPRWSLQPVVRVELFDDDRGLDDAGDLIAFSAGVNARLIEHTRVQLHYLGRMERFGQERANDAVVLNLQGEF